MALDTLPATSVWLNRTVFGPSTAVNELLQLVPLLIEYWTSAPFSTAQEGQRAVIVWDGVESEPPLSVVSATPSAACEPSRVKLKLVALDTLPATSVWRTRTVFGPSTAVNELLQLVPLLIEYWTSARFSNAQEG